MINGIAFMISNSVSSMPYKGTNYLSTFLHRNYSYFNFLDDLIMC